MRYRPADPQYLPTQYDGGRTARHGVFPWWELSDRTGAEYLGSQLLFYIGKFMKYGRLDSAIGPDEVPWPAWKPELQQDM